MVRRHCLYSIFRISVLANTIRIGSKRVVSRCSMSATSRTPGGSLSAQIRYVKNASLGKRQMATLNVIKVKVTKPVRLPFSSLPQIRCRLTFFAPAPGLVIVATVPPEIRDG
ncbi:hypothetical protein RvY_11942 [Ramazzottius varieornatus]|uniref:Uncharacterized protein n=1 Tax=Ramazzottius varieornatus TaxID=947166 RepID=A0A1D1VQH7_RAMVA|nr:hypothetical protein RvY_11942 [Ramazzottius varieornatus]